MIVSQRRSPIQKRGRKRVDRILDVAEQLVARDGFVNVTMSEIARVAEMPLATVYQYFSNRTELLRALSLRQLRKQQAVLGEALASASLSEDWERGVDAIVDASASFFRDNPVYFDVWSGLQADQQLRRLDVEDTRETSELLAPLLEQLMPEVPARRLRAVTALLQLAVFSALRFALTEGAGVDLDTMTDEIKVLVRSYATVLIERYGP